MSRSADLDHRTPNEIFFLVAIFLILILLMPVAIGLLILFRLYEALIDSRAGKAVYAFWYGRRA